MATTDEVPTTCVSHLVPLRLSGERSGTLLLLSLHDQGLVDVRDDTTAGDGGLDQRVELLVTADGEKEMSGRDSLHLKILRGVTSELQNLSSQVLKDSGRVDGGSGTNSTVGADSALQESVDSSDGELSLVSHNSQINTANKEPTHVHQVVTHPCVRLEALASVEHRPKGHVTAGSIRGDGAIAN